MRHLSTLTALAVLLVFALPTFGQTATVTGIGIDNDPIGDLPYASVVSFKAGDTDNIGVLPFGWVERANGALTVFVDLPDGTPVTAWTLSDDGVPILPTTLQVASRRVTFFGDNDGGLDLPMLGSGGLPPTIAFRLDTYNVDGDIGTIGIGVLEYRVDDDWGLPATIDPPPGEGSSVNGGSVIGTDGDGSTTGFATGKCNKAKCRLKIILANGSTITDELIKDETYHVSSQGVVYVVCGCD